MKAIVRRIVDGDTLIVDIYIGVQVILPTPPAPGKDTKLGMDLYVDSDGMLVMRKVRARLYNFNAAEMDTPEGVLAKERLAAALPVGTEITVKLHGKDKYGRWLVVPMLNDTDVCLSLAPCEPCITPVLVV